MGKRLSLTCATLLAAAVVVAPPANIFAVDNMTDDVLDYAYSIGAIEGMATLNRVVEATTDGGYIVGGQAAGCKKYNDDGTNELVDPQQCEEYYMRIKGTTADAQFWASPSIEKLCETKFNRKNVLKEGVTGTYDYACVDYVTKFKADGTREWLTLLKDDQFLPLAVGETQNDYRMYTGSYLLYIFDKTTGELKSENYADTIGTPTISKAKINTKGYVYLADVDNSTPSGPNFIIITGDGKYIRSAPTTTDSSYLSAWNLVMNDDYVYAAYEHYDSLKKEYVDEVVTISELLRKKTIVTAEKGRWQDVFSLDDEGNFLILECDYNDNPVTIPEGSYGINCVFRSYDKNGEVLAEKKAEDVGYYYGDGDGDVISDNYTFYDSSTGELKKLNKLLEVEYRHVLDESETIYDITALNDGSIVAVGLGEVSTDNYTVEGVGNGIQLRLGVTAKETLDEAGDGTDEANEPIKNPSTLDNFKAMAIGGAVVLLGAALLCRKMTLRR